VVCLHVSGLPGKYKYSWQRSWQTAKDRSAGKGREGFSIFPLTEWYNLRVCGSESHSVVSDSLWHGLYTVHGTLQARILQWVAFPFSRGSSQPRDKTQVSHIGGELFTSWATREAQEYWSGQPICSPGELPNPGIELGSPALQEDSLPAELPGKPRVCGIRTKDFSTFRIPKAIKKQQQLENNNVNIKNWEKEGEGWGKYKGGFHLPPWETNNVKIW